MKNLYESIFGSKKSITSSTDKELIQELTEVLTSMSANPVKSAIKITDRMIDMGQNGLKIDNDTWDKYKDILAKYTIKAAFIYLARRSDSSEIIDLNGTTFITENVIFCSSTKNADFLHVQEIQLGLLGDNVPDLILDNIHIKEVNKAIKFELLQINISIKNSSFPFVNNIGFTNATSKQEIKAFHRVDKLFEPTTEYDAHGEKFTIKNTNTYKKYIKPWWNDRWDHALYKLKKNSKLHDIFPWIESFPDLSIIQMQNGNKTRIYIENEKVWLVNQFPADKYSSNHITSDGWIVLIS